MDKSVNPRDTLDRTSAVITPPAVSTTGIRPVKRAEAMARTSGRQSPPATFGVGLSPAQGDRIGENGRFEIVDKLGAGGMGHVFRAVDWHLDRTVAVKFILQNREIPLEQLAAMLKREAKTTAKLHHENIVAIFDMDTYEGVPFLVMELLDGQSLNVMLEALPACACACDAHYGAGGSRHCARPWQRHHGEKRTAAGRSGVSWSTIRASTSG